VHLVTSGYFRSRDKDGGQTIRSAIAEETHANYIQTLWLYVLYNRSYYRWKFYIAGIGIFLPFCSCDLDFDPMTFIYKLDPYCL